MKVSKILFNLLKYYLIGNLLFNTIFTITEVVFANILSLHITFFDIFVKNIYYNLYLYTVLYFIIISIFYGINIYIVKELNKRLKRGEKSEK